MWTPIVLEELKVQMQKTEHELKDELLVLWKLIKITPEKWLEMEYGNEGGGFWVVAVFGKQVIWYNDIEEGFNISTYAVYGELSEYGAEQDELNICIDKLSKMGLYRAMNNKS